MSYREEKRNDMLRLTGVTILANSSKTNKISWRNFSGSPTDADRVGGKRYFNVDLNKCDRIEIGNDATGWRRATVQDLIDNGWMVRTLDPNPEYPDYDVAIPLKINIGNNCIDRGRVKQITLGGTVALDEDTIGGLDRLWIDNAKLKVHAFTDWGDGTRKSAWLTTAFIYVHEDMNDEWD